MLFKKKFHCFSNNLFVWKCFQTKIVFDTCIEMASNTNNDLRLFQFKTPREYENISQRGEFEFILLNSTFLRSIYLDFRKRNQRKHNQRKRQKCRLLFNNIPLKLNILFINIYEPFLSCLQSNEFLGFEGFDFKFA